MPLPARSFGASPRPAARITRRSGRASRVVVAVAGGSGAGKTWLVKHLARRLGSGAGVLSLDAFYLDRSHLSARQRARVNFDHPRAVDWHAFRRALDRWTRGREACVPVYDYATHTRQGRAKQPAPRRIVLLDGLWVLCPSDLRERAALRVFVACSRRLRLGRRVRRDARERGRARREVIRRFREQVEPMYRRFVEPQRRRADIVVRSPVAPVVLDRLVARIRAASRCSRD